MAVNIWAEVLTPFFLFLLFSVCHYAVN